MSWQGPSWTGPTHRLRTIVSQQIMVLLVPDLVPDMNMSMESPTHGQSQAHVTYVAICDTGSVTDTVVSATPCCPAQPAAR